MNKNIILDHVRFLEMFRWFMKKGILKTNHKSPIMYHTEKEAAAGFHRILHKGIKLLTAQYGIKSVAYGQNMRFSFTTEQIAILRGKKQLKLTQIIPDYGWRVYRISCDPYTVNRFNITTYLDMLFEDIKNISETAELKPLVIEKKVRKPAKPKIDKNTEKLKEQMFFNEAMTKRLR